MKTGRERRLLQRQAQKIKDLEEKLSKIQSAPPVNHVPLIGVNQLPINPVLDFIPGNLDNVLRQKDKPSLEQITRSGYSPRWGDGVSQDGIIAWKE